ncbi:hypothetical protein PLESTF_001055200 [Pleodorina starrii]|nr:hypothetical protein PLESTM_001639400 [Pleodorina starrii]GLC70959.1 hypothetical protein PLESTF_001055200 [Pleodorina starrii]
MGDEELIRTALEVPEGDVEATEDHTAATATSDGGAAAAAQGTEEEAEDEPQSEAEAKAEQLLLAATTAWNVQGNRDKGVKLAKAALEVLKTGPHRAKCRSEVASSLADMLYATGNLAAALDAVGEAIDAARQGGEWALVVKLSNNMGAVYKKLNRFSDAEALHRSCYSMAVSELGVAHPLSLLARSNLTETLMLRKPLDGAPGEAASAAAGAAAGGAEQPESEEDKEARREARQVLKTALEQLEAEAESQRAALGTTAATSAEAGAGASSGSEGGGELPASALYRRTRTAIVRTHIELGRLEMVAGEDKEAAEGAYRAALALCDELYGVDSRESGGPAFSLANCLRAIGKKEEAQVLYERLYNLAVKRDTLGEETAVHLARSLAALAEEAGDWAAVDKYSTSALNSMFQLIGTKVHPVLEDFYKAACRAKAQNGDAAGAEALKRQFLSGMLRISQQQARAQHHPGGRGGGGPAGMMAGAAGAGQGGAPGGKKSSGGGAGKKGRK